MRKKYLELKHSLVRVVLRNNMNRIIHSILAFIQRKKNVFILFFIILSVLIFLILVQYFMKPSQVVETSPEIITSLEQPKGIVRITFAENIPQPPTSLEIYSLQELTNNPVAAARLLAEKMNMIPAEEKYLENTWFDAEKTSSLSISSKGLVVYLSDPKIKSQKTSTESEKIDAATNFLSSVINTTGLTIDKARIRYTDASGEKVAGLNGEILIIPYVFQLQNYSLYYNDALVDFATVYITQNLEVIKAEFMSPPLSPQVKSNTSVISQDEIKHLILSKKAKLISNYYVKEQVTIDEIENLHITNMEIQYRYTSQSLLITPYVLLTGVGSTRDGRQLSQQFLVSAEKTN